MTALLTRLELQVHGNHRVVVEALSLLEPPWSSGLLPAVAITLGIYPPRWLFWRKPTTVKLTLRAKDGFALPEPLEISL